MFFLKSSNIGKYERIEKKLKNEEFCKNQLNKDPDKDPNNIQNPSFFLETEDLVFCNNKKAEDPENIFCLVEKGDFIPNPNCFNSNLNTNNPDCPKLNTNNLKFLQINENLLKLLPNNEFYELILKTGPNEFTQYMNIISQFVKNVIDIDTHNIGAFLNTINEQHKLLENITIHFYFSKLEKKCKQIAKDFNGINSIHGSHLFFDFLMNLIFYIQLRFEDNNNLNEDLKILENCENVESLKILHETVSKFCIDFNVRFACLLDKEKERDRIYFKDNEIIDLMQTEFIEMCVHYKFLYNIYKICFQIKTQLDLKFGNLNLNSNNDSILRIDSFSKFMESYESSFKDLKNFQNIKIVENLIDNVNTYNSFIEKTVIILQQFENQNLNKTPEQVDLYICWRRNTIKRLLIKANQSKNNNDYEEHIKNKNNYEDQIKILENIRYQTLQKNIKDNNKKIKDLLGEISNKLASNLKNIINKMKLKLKLKFKLDCKNILNNDKDSTEFLNYCDIFQNKKIKIHKWLDKINQLKVKYKQYQEKIKQITDKQDQEKMINICTLIENFIEIFIIVLAKLQFPLKDIGRDELVKIFENYTNILLEKIETEEKILSTISNDQQNVKEISIEELFKINSQLNEQYQKTKNNIRDLEIFYKRKIYKD